jgi:hypothetical protein
MSTAVPLVALATRSVPCECRERAATGAQPMHLAT